jgi:hypothetical protein
LTAAPLAEAICVKPRSDTPSRRTDSRLGRHELAGANISSAHQRQPGPVASRQRLCGSTPSAFMHMVSVPSAQYVGSS